MSQGAGRPAERAREGKDWSGDRVLFVPKAWAHISQEGPSLTNWCTVHSQEICDISSLASNLAAVFGFHQLTQSLQSGMVCLIFPDFDTCEESRTLQPIIGCWIVSVEGASDSWCSVATTEAGEKEREEHVLGSWWPYLHSTTSLVTKVPLADLLPRVNSSSWTWLHVLLIINKTWELSSKITSLGDFPGGPVVKTPCLQCKGHRFDPWLGNLKVTFLEEWLKLLEGLSPTTSCSVNLPELPHLILNNGPIL